MDIAHILALNTVLCVFTKSYNALIAQSTHQINCPRVRPITASPSPMRTVTPSQASPVFVSSFCIELEDGSRTCRSRFCLSGSIGCILGVRFRSIRSCRHAHRWCPSRASMCWPAANMSSFRLYPKENKIYDSECVLKQACIIKNRPQPEMSCQYGMTC